MTASIAALRVLQEQTQQDVAFVAGHSLGEYGALVAAGAITFEDALKAVSARGNEMTRCALDDNRLMAAVFGPIDKIEEILNTVEDYVVIANINSTREAVIGGSTVGVEKAMAAVREAATLLTGKHDFNEVVFEDVFVADDYVLGEVDGAWKQATSELAYERSGPERFLETYYVLMALIRAVSEAEENGSDVRVSEGIGRLVAQLHTLRRMSVSVAGMLEGFDASTECREVTCLYNHANWWIEGLIHDDARPRVEELPGEDTFL